MEYVGFHHWLTAKKVKFSYSNLLAANGLSKPFADGKSTGDSALAVQGGVATLTERSDATFSVEQFSSVDGE